MSSGLAATPRGIPIPVDQIRSALESVAVPGWDGSIQVVIGLREEAAQHVAIAVVRRERRKIGEPSHLATVQELPDPARKKPVEKVLADLSSKLMIKTVIEVVELQVVDGVLKDNFLVQD